MKKQNTWKRMIFCTALPVLFSTAAAALSVEIRSQSAEVTLLHSFSDVLGYIGTDGVNVKLAPGTYRLPSTLPDAEPLISMTGSNSRFDFTDVTLITERNCGTVFGLIGNKILLEGLHLQMLPGENPKDNLGPLGLNIIGNSNVLQNVTVRIENSFPYGYGSYFGIGTGSLVQLYKGCGIRIGPAGNTRILGCNVVMRAFGHGIFIRGAQDTLIEDTVVEGELRQTDDILAETSGTAFDLGFTGIDGIIRPDRITSLQEDGIRIYSDSGTSRNYTGLNNRPTGKVTVRNCTVRRMRRGICLALGGSGHVVTGCEVTECARAGYNLGSATVVRDSRGDAKYSPILELASQNSNHADIELTVLDSRERQINSFENDPGLLVNINGYNHRVVLTPEFPDSVPDDMTIEIGGPVGRSKDNATVRGDNVTLVNGTKAWVLLHPQAAGCSVETVGRMVDYGPERNNTIIPVP